MKTILDNINNQVKSRQAKAAENLAAARLENSFVFQIDDEPIPGVDIPSSGSSSIALMPRPNKRRRDADQSCSEPTTDVISLTKGFEKAATILANANCATTPGKDKPIVDRLEQRVGLIELVSDPTRTLACAENHLYFLYSLGKTSAASLLARDGGACAARTGLVAEKGEPPRSPSIYATDTWSGRGGRN